MVRTGLLSLGICAAAVLSFVPRPGVAQDDIAPGSVTEQEAAIHQAAVRFVELYNAGDADGIAALFAPDAEIMTRSGDAVRGRESIRASFAETFARTPDAAISLRMDDLRFLTDDVAVERGVTTYYPDGESPTVESRYTVVHVRKDGTWLMSAARTVEDVVLSNRERLRALEWLVGDWVDEGADSVVEASYAWSEDGNYLLQSFRVRTGSGVLMEGTQRIGWDPQAKRIRSWIFDSDGGFGEGVWTQVGDEWIVKLQSVLKDGSSAFSSRRLTPRGPDHIIVSMTDRVVDGESLPDLQVTMARRPPLPVDESE
ncbi:SnoaL-like domain protein [Maioricimonas rarisocia]|uniref:SnoaL-like domain protein n=1 Tax=Maioricimonas rarisocia TaxID=2528026 RepID=A0A517Z175_9PLAN|nr:SgcJ/EcaC family oxidoreductase [Maioricimonas rarisocia]QDU36221.1 SnoaL-like domain protein [Maioricimonas rarisocia]